MGFQLCDLLGSICLCVCLSSASNLACPGLARAVLPPRLRLYTVGVPSRLLAAPSCSPLFSGAGPSPSDSDWHTWGLPLSDSDWHNRGLQLQPCSAIRLLRHGVC